MGADAKRTKSEQDSHCVVPRVWGSTQRQESRITFCQGFTSLSKLRELVMDREVWCAVVQASSGSWWWTGRSGVLQSMGSQRVGQDWATELNWTVGGVRRRRSFQQQIQSFSCAKGINSSHPLYNSLPVVNKIVSSPTKSRRADLM